MISQWKESAVRARAYQLWIESGYADGYQDAHWRQAEREMSRQTGEVSPPVRPIAQDHRHIDGMSLYRSVIDPAPDSAHS
ncbi:MAG: DUF2934 domain-containing protein [Janthinobacterium lividum]